MANSDNLQPAPSSNRDYDALYYAVKELEAVTAALQQIQSNQTTGNGNFKIIRGGTGNNNGSWKKIIVLDDIRFNELYKDGVSYMAAGNLTNEYLSAKVELFAPDGSFFTLINIEAGRLIAVE